jgi:hypothetical protein
MRRHIGGCAAVALTDGKPVKSEFLMAAAAVACQSGLFAQLRPPGTGLAATYNGQHARDLPPAARTSGEVRGQ